AGADGLARRAEHAVAAALDQDLAVEARVPAGEALRDGLAARPAQPEQAHDLAPADGQVQAADLRLAPPAPTHELERRVGGRGRLWPLPRPPGGGAEQPRDQFWRRRPRGGHVLQASAVAEHDAPVAAVEDSVHPVGDEATLRPVAASWRRIANRFRLSEL